MNRKGFTLVELIAMLVVISILMVLAIPNITGILQDNRKSMGVEDVNKMVMGAKTKVNTKKANNPSSENSCVVLTLDFIDTNHDLVKGVNEGNYDRVDSFVVIKKVIVDHDDGGHPIYGYEYYVRLVETEGSRNYVLNFVNYEDFSQNPTASVVQDSVSSINGSVSNDEVKSIINSSGGTVSCGSVTQVYK